MLFSEAQQRKREGDTQWRHPVGARLFLTGCRSADQLRALHWTGTLNPSAYFEHMVVFSIAEQDIHDAL